MQKITNFFKYNNAFVIILGTLFLVAGSSFASEKVRDTVIGQTIEEVKGIDNSALLSASLDSLKQEMSIADVSEDEENYYVAYSFSTFDIKGNIWQNQTKNQILKVPKEALNGGKDLGLYIQGELAQVMDGYESVIKKEERLEPPYVAPAAANPIVNSTNPSSASEPTSDVGSASSESSSPEASSISSSQTSSSESSISSSSSVAI